MKTHHQIIRFGILIVLSLGIAGCTPAPTPEQKRNAEFHCKYPGADYDPLVGYVRKKR